MILEKVKQIIASTLDMDEEDISPQDSLEEDLGADEMTKWDIFLNIEDEFDLEHVDPGIYDDVETVQDLAEVIKSETE